MQYRLNEAVGRPQPARRPASHEHKRPPSDDFKTNIVVDCMGLNPIGGRMSGVDRVVFGSDDGPIPCCIDEPVQIVESVVPRPDERQQVFWKTSNGLFRLGFADTDRVTPLPI